MKICFVGDFSAALDEGMKKTAFHLADEIAVSHTVLRLDPRDAFTTGFWRKLRRFDPDIIHYVSGPTIKSFLVVKLLHARCRRAKTVMSATQPVLSARSRWLIPALKPDLMLVQSNGMDRVFRDMGMKTGFLYNGVDIGKYRPVSGDEKKELRRSFGIAEDAFVVLHVGSLIKLRNLDILIDIQQQPGVQAVIVGSTTGNLEKDVYERLTAAGCRIWREYFPEVEKIYALADCYVFPVTIPTGGIECPLSVLEAMSCNLPVITTRYGGLADFLGEGKGLYYADAAEEFLETLARIRTGEHPVGTRSQVEPYSWGNIADKLGELYTGLEQQGR